MCEKTNTTNITTRVLLARNNIIQEKKVMEAKGPVMPTPTVLPNVTPKAQVRSTSPTKRAAEPTTLDVPPQAMHPRGEDSQMDV